MVALSQSGQEKPPRTHLVGTLPSTIPSAALLVTLLLGAGCGRTTMQAVTSGPHPTATQAATSIATSIASPTISILPAASLSWTVGKLLPFSPCAMGDTDNLTPNNFLAGVSIDPGDGNIAYTCELAASSAGGLALWMTHDRARHWTPLAPLPSVGRQLDVCIIIPDAADPSIVVVNATWVSAHEFAGPAFETFIPDFVQFVTFDGGVHWQLLHGPEPFVLQWLATYHGTTLAMLEGRGGSAHLWSSTDQMQTWHELPQAPRGEPFINPVTGDLLVVDNFFSNQGYIDQSTDLGQHWTAHLIPTGLTGGPLLVSPPAVGHPWRLCGTGSTFVCSMDSGRTWASPPQLATTFDNTSKGIVVPETAQSVAVGADGTIYADLASDLQPLGIPGGLYQLTPQATLWQPLTLPPGDAAGDTTSTPATVDTTDLPGPGILWTVPGELNLEWLGSFLAASA
jgi:hypothetical protein